MGVAEEEKDMALASKADGVWGDLENGWKLRGEEGEEEGGSSTLAGERKAEGVTNTEEVPEGGGGERKRMGGRDG